MLTIIGAHIIHLFALLRIRIWCHKYSIDYVFIQVLLVIGRGFQHIFTINFLAPHKLFTSIWSVNYQCAQNRP